jgi:hypothetical protein
MVRLYADENFPLVIVELLRTFGHDVLIDSSNSSATVIKLNHCIP